MDFSGGREIPCLLDSSAKKILRERLASLLVGHFNTKQLMKSLKEFYSNSNRALKVWKDLWGNIPMQAIGCSPHKSTGPKCGDGVT